jgi:hypothetical protein
MASTFKQLPIIYTSNPGSVDSFNSRTGAVVPLNSDYTASQIDNIPAGGIGSTNLQDAINELDDEKQSEIYTPGASSDWDGDPATIVEALDRIAALLKILNSGTPVP